MWPLWKSNENNGFQFTVCHISRTTENVREAALVSSDWCFGLDAKCQMGQQKKKKTRTLQITLNTSSSVVETYWVWMESNTGQYERKSVICCKRLNESSDLNPIQPRQDLNFNVHRFFPFNNGFGLAISPKLHSPGIQSWSRQTSMLWFYKVLTLFLCVWMKLTLFLFFHKISDKMMYEFSSSAKSSTVLCWSIP